MGVREPGLRGAGGWSTAVVAPPTPERAGAPGQAWPVPPEVLPRSRCPDRPVGALLTEDDLSAFGSSLERCEDVIAAMLAVRDVRRTSRTAQR